MTSTPERITWVVLRPERFSWGLKRHWMGERSVAVSDPERTLLDGLHLPRHAGGVTEVAAALARAWPDLDQRRLAGHLDRLGIEAVRRRLGAVLDTMDLRGSEELTARLAATRTYRTAILLDASLPADGDVDRRWGVRMNVDREEIAAAGQT